MRNLFLLASCAMHTRQYTHLDRWNHVPDDFKHGGSRGNVWFQDNWEPVIRCVDDKRLGTWGDGGKWICDPECLLQKNSCNIFSIGSQNDFRFEDAMKPYGCTINTFDHTTLDANPPAHVTFHQIGISSKSDDQFKSLTDMVELTGIQGRIDVLKIDCEGEFRLQYYGSYLTQ